MLPSSGQIYDILKVYSEGVFFMQSKYHNKKVSFNGKLFDSKKELQRYKQLLLQQKAGAITDLETQVKFLLIPTQRDDNGKVIERECSYYADFTYKDSNNNTVVEDTKGVRTAEYIIKRKLMLMMYGIRIIEI